MTASQEIQKDFIIRAGQWATVWSFEPCTERAKEFVREYLEIDDWQWLGKSFAVDHRPARDLAEQLGAEGFIIWHPSFGFHKSCAHLLNEEE